MSMRPTKTELRRLIQTHRGSRAAIARALVAQGVTSLVRSVDLQVPVTRIAVAGMLRDHGLLDEADEAAFRARRSGPRAVADDTARAEMARIKQALAKYPRRADAARALGMSEATMYRRMREYGLGGVDDTTRKAR